MPWRPALLKLKCPVKFASSQPPRCRPGFYCAALANLWISPMQSGSWLHALVTTSPARFCTWTVDLRWNKPTTYIMDTTQNEIMAIYPKIAALIAEALPCEVEKVKLDASLIDDLG